MADITTTTDDFLIDTFLGGGKATGKEGLNFCFFFLFSPFFSISEIARKRLPIKAFHVE